VLLKKLEGYLKTLNIKSGIDPDKSPDKEWLVLALATVSGGKDEIFEPNYMPNRSSIGTPKQSLIDLAVDLQVPAHLLGFGKGRHLTVGGPSKEEKVAQQIEAAEQRLLKQEGKKKKLMEALDVIKSKDKQQMQKVQEREKVK
jgi:hypothetical protein